MSKTKNSTASEYTKIYSELRGVDFSELPTEPEKRYAYLENMYVDYEAGGGVESIPGFRSIASLGGKINRIFSHRRGGKEYLAVHSGESLYYFNADERDLLQNITPIMTRLKDTRSCGFSYGENLYIIDGNGIVLIDKHGSVQRITKESPGVYIPKTHIDGKKHESRNLLTDNFQQQFTIREADEMSYGSDGLKYAILDYETRLCGVSGASEDFAGELHIPSYTMIGASKFKVTEILDYAFENHIGITKLFTNCNLETIGHRAFAGCTALTDVYLSDTVRAIGTYSFDGCSALSRFYIGSGFRSFGSMSFEKCVSLKTLYYAKSSDDFRLVENQPAFEDRFIEFNIPRKSVKLSVSLYGGVKSITDVTANGSPVDFTFKSDRQVLIIDCDDRELLHGKTIIICGKFGSSGEGILATDMREGISNDAIILGCTVTASFDGRVFISGNPNLPGVVFYSGLANRETPHPLYFSVDDYFIDGTGGYPVSSLLTVGERLLVFKSGDDGAGSIYYHTRYASESGSGYPVSHIRNGINLSGESAVFMGEGVFASSLGICAAIDDTGEYPRINCLSEKISGLLVTQPISGIRLAEWQGYLAVLTEGKIFLADSRNKYRFGDDYRYEWYYLNGIGTYRNSKRVFRYSSVPTPGYDAHPLPDTKATGEIYSTSSDGENTVYYSLEPEGMFSVYCTDEYEGGDFYPATEIFALGKLLFFGNECGDICVFNNDKRGVPPPMLAAEHSFDLNEYKKKMGTAIHPYYYTFGMHEVSYTLATVPDDCGLPYMEKNTVRGTCTLKFKCMSDAEITVMTKTDSNGIRELCRIHSGTHDFSSSDFSRIALDGSGYATLALKEYERGWIEKQYILNATGFRTPIGIHSLSYRYKTKGKIRNK